MVIHRFVASSLVAVLTVLGLGVWATQANAYPVKFPQACINTIYDGYSFLDEWETLVGPTDAELQRDELGVPSNFGLLGFQLDADARGEDATYESDELLRQMGVVGDVQREFFDAEWERCKDRLDSMSFPRNSRVDTCAQAVFAARTLASEKVGALMETDEGGVPTGAFGEYLKARAGGGSGLEYVDGILDAVAGAQEVANDFLDLDFDCDS